jgi:hypothetical protein
LPVEKEIIINVCKKYSELLSDEYMNSLRV